MGLRLGRHNFTRVVYDESSDVLYASQPGTEPARRETTPEDDIWLFDERDRFVGIRLMEPGERYARDGAVWVSLPTGERERAVGIQVAMRGNGRG